jgi:hypothetical protein|tara:strand:+ start:204 stop:713 length:510 start_codon:yes stop_codon:yes gene_type:complete
MGLLQVNTTTITSATSSVTLTGIDDDSVYMLVLSNVAPSNDSKYLNLKFTVGGSASSTSNYDYAQYFQYTSGSAFGLAGTNGTSVNITNHRIGTGTSETVNGIFMVYNANNTSEYTFMSTESANMDESPKLYGTQGGIVFTATDAVDGFYFSITSSSIASGTFTLYKVV